MLAYRGAAFEISEPEDLLASLRAALTARPDLWHAWSAVVLQLVDMHQLDEALALARQATERFPLLPRLWVDLAQVHRARRERESEIAPLQRALQITPAWSRASQLLANTHERMGNYAEAARILEQAIAAAPLDPVNHGSLANVLHHLNRKDEALQRLEHALKLEPGYDWAWDVLRAWSPGAGMENRAVVLARELADLRPDEARSWLVLAKVLNGAPVAERLEALDRALSLNPRFIDAHDARAMLFADAQRYDEAAAACSPAIYGESVPTPLRGRAAWVEAQRNRTRAAIGKMREIVAAAPDYYWGWNMLAEWLCADNDFADAEEAARKMARLAPRSAIPLGYLADIQARCKKLDAAYVTLQKAFDIDPTYGFAGFTLFDHRLEENKFNEAEKLLATITTHLPGPAAIGAKIRIDTKRGRYDAAVASFRELLATPTVEARTLHAVVNAMVAARWSREVEEGLVAVLHLSGTNPEIGAIWVRRFAARQEWKCRKRLFQLSSVTPLGRHARIAYIEELARHQRKWLLRRLISRERPFLRTYGPAWGTIGYAYVHLGRWSDAIKWMKDWQQRNDLAPWMLLNLATAYRQIGPDRNALAVNQHALKLPPDHTTSQHRLWIVLEIALLGDMPAVASRLAELREHELGNYEQALLALIKALRAMHEAQPTARRAIFTERCDDLARRYQQGAYADPALNRARRRTLLILCRLNGDSWRWLRPWLPGFGGVGGPGERGKIRPATIFAFFVVLSALLRTCQESPPASSTPVVRPLARTPSPFQPRDPQSLGQPPSIQFSPKPEDTIRLLPTPFPVR